MANLEMALGNMLLLIFVVLELLIIKYTLKKALPWKELIMNLNSGHILLWIFRGLEVGGYYYASQYVSLHLINHLPSCLSWVFAFILWDFMFYWLHYTHHKIKWLWKVHVVHHEGEHYSLSLGIRNSWYSSLTSFPYFVVMALFGFPTEMFVTVSSIHYFVQFYNHNHLVRNSGWLDYIMVTPKHHRVHHGKNRPYIDKNFGGTLVIWDKIFGTFQEEISQNPVQYGVDEPVQSNNPVLVNNIPFVNKRKIVDTDKNPQPVKLPNPLLISGAFLLFMELLLFIYLENVLQLQQKVLFFCIVFSGTIALGLLMDGKKIGIPLWIVFRIAGPIVMLFQTNIETPLVFILFSLSGIHGMLTIKRFVQLVNSINERYDRHL